MEEIDKSILTIEECKKILNKNGKKYTDEEVNVIRRTLYGLAHIEYATFIDGKFNNESETNSNSPQVVDEGK